MVDISIAATLITGALLQMRDVGKKISADLLRNLLRSDPSFSRKLGIPRKWPAVRLIADTIARDNIELSMVIVTCRSRTIYRIRTCDIERSIYGNSVTSKISGFLTAASMAWPEMSEMIRTDVYD